MALTKIVNGVEIVMSAEEEAAILAEWAANPPLTEEQLLQTVRDRAKAFIDGLDPVQRAFVAGFDAARKGDNVLRKWLMDFKAGIATATTLAQVKTMVAGLTNLPELSKMDVVAIIKGLIQTPS